MVYSRFFVPFCVLALYICVCGCIDISEITILKIKRAIKLFEERVGERPSGSLLVREWPGSQSSDQNDSSHSTSVDWYTCPPVLLWDVIHSHPELLSRYSCPFCSAAGIVVGLRRSGKWADNTSSSCSYEPRVVYDTNCALLLVSHIYVCPSNHQVPAHHPSILSALPSSIYVPFFLTNRAGFTVDMLTQLSSMVDSGLSFHSIANIVRELYEESYWRLRLRYEQDSSSSTNNKQSFLSFEQKYFPLPHEQIIRSVFISYSLQFDEVFYEDMACRTSRWLACDHTFKSAANIGFTRQCDRRWIKVMKCVFIVLDTDGKIVHWRFTKGESFDEVSGIFKELKARFERLNAILNGIVIDNCCKWRGHFSQIFGNNILIKLDLFHAVQRFVTTLPMPVRLSTDICKSYGLVFRQSCDLGIKRLKPTPNKETLLGNLESFERKWSSKMWKGEKILNPAAKKAITNIRSHMVKGCLSDIPVDVSTSGNERLHRHMNNVLKTNKIGLESAYVRCTRLFFKINNQGDNSKVALLACLKGSADFSQRTEHFGFETLNQGNEELEVIVPEKRKVVIYKSLDELNEQNIYDLRKTISVSLQVNKIQDEHTYAQDIDHKNNVALAIADSAINFYEVYRGLSHGIGATRLLLKHNLPSSVGLGLENTLSTLRTSCDFDIRTDTDNARAVLSGHLQGFGLEEIETQGDGNCFFTAVAFHISNVLSSGVDEEVNVHLSRLGLRPSNTVQELSATLRQLIVQEWRGDFASEYENFLPDGTDYLFEVRQYERPGFFGGNIGDLMPMAMANLLGIPIAIITSEPSTPLVSVCPRGFVITPTPIFLAYISSGPGHYNAVSWTPSGTDKEEAWNKDDSDDKEKQNVKVQMTPPLSLKGCRCGRGTQENKKTKTKKYNSKKRCSCLVKFKSCSNRCKCTGRCGGGMCKQRIIKSKKKTNSSPRFKHVLQRKKQLMFPSSQKENTTPNFLEICLLCSIINYLRSGFITSWDADMIYNIYSDVTEALMTLGITLPLRKWSKELIWKQVLKLKRDII